ncbi:hypothetical protein ACQ4PT_000501 [Festuca glaucescens]
MANFPVDPTPFIPGQFEILEVANRPQQCCYHVSGRASAKHEDLAIATITPALPANQPFAATRLFLRSFIEDELHLSLAFPSDYWSDEHIRGAVKDFGAMISWDKDVSTYGALIVKVRVTDLHHIPHSCVISTGNEWAAESWSVPVFILSQRLLGALPADEDLPPADGTTPHPMPPMPFHAPAADDVVDVPIHQAAPGLPLWHNGQMQAPVDPPVNLAGQNLAFLGVNPNGHLDINVVPHNIAIDLNAAPHQLNEEDFLELNDLLDPVIHNHHQPPVIFALPAPNLPPQLPEDIEMNQPEEVHSDIIVTISSADTMSDESGDSVNGGFPQLQQQNVNIGLALLPDIQVDPVAVLCPSYAQWANFFTAKLLTHEDFDWAKSLLQSKIWQILSELDVPSDISSRTFALPRKCPTQAPPVCTLSFATLEATQGFLTPQARRKQIKGQPPSSTSALHLKKKISKASKPPLACSEVRRSTRIKALHKGYKVRTCFDKNCLACAAVAPPIKKSVVRNLCHKFNIPEEDAAEEEAEDEQPAVSAGAK